MELSTADGAYSQELLHTWDQWLPAEGSQGTTVDPGAPGPVYSLSPSIPTSPSVHQVEVDRLCLLQPDDWDQEKDYGADPPVCIRYTIIWKNKLNNRMIAKDTEQDVVLAPGPYWSMFLQPKLDALLSKKIHTSKRVRTDDSIVVVSVNERSERDLIRRFDEVQVDWSVVEKQLLSWGELLHAGRRLRVDISFNDVEIQAALSARGSTTQRMLAERAAQLDAEEASGTPSTWREIYALMRCPGAPCDLEPHCWRDPDGAEAVTLENALDLDLIYEENDPDFFEKQGVKRGTAKRWVRDIPRWARRYKADDVEVVSLVS
jgi:hypothetical protein